jgi:RimJ/RimL family protein N-acetyltransferase
VPWDDRWTDDLVALTADEQVMRYIGRGGPWARAEALERSRAAADHWDEHGFGWRAVVERATGTWAGLIALNRLGPGIEGVAEDEIEIGWWLHPAAWHRGIGIEGARAVCDEAFGRLGADRLIARCRPANRRSLAVMRRLGMAPWRTTTGRHGEVLGIHALDRAAWRP